MPSSIETFPASEKQSPFPLTKQAFYPLNLILWIFLLPLSRLYVKASIKRRESIESKFGKFVYFIYKKTRRSDVLRNNLRRCSGPLEITEKDIEPLLIENCRRMGRALLHAMEEIWIPPSKAPLCISPESDMSEPRRLIEEGKSVFILTHHTLIMTKGFSFPLLLPVEKAVTIGATFKNPVIRWAWGKGIGNRKMVFLPPGDVLKLKSEFKKHKVLFHSSDHDLGLKSSVMAKFFGHDANILTFYRRMALRQNATAFALSFELDDQHRAIIKATHLPKYSDAKVNDVEAGEEYHRFLEKTIKKDIPNWLWAHNRFKRADKVNKEKAKEKAKEKNKAKEQPSEKAPERDKT